MVFFTIIIFPMDVTDDVYQYKSTMNTKRVINVHRTTHFSPLNVYVVHLDPRLKLSSVLSILNYLVLNVSIECLMLFIYYTPLTPRDTRTKTNH